MDSRVRASKPNPLTTANVLSRLLFWWINPLFKVGYKRKLEENDMYNVLPEDLSCRLRADLERAWDVVSANGGKHILLRALWRCYAKGWILLALPLLLEETMKVAQPLLMGRLVLYFSPGSHVTLTEAYLCAFGISACALLSGMLHHQIYFLTQKWGWRKRVAVCSLIYKKALRLSNAALLKTTTGQIVNLMSNDVNRFDLGFQFIHYLWIGPVQAIVISVILWKELGPSCLAGLGFMVFLFPLQSAMGKLFSKYRSQTAHRTDERVRTMSEIISAMRVIKMYTWEEPFGDLVTNQRRREVQKIAKAVTCQGLNLAFSFVSVRVISLLAFATYVLLGNTITASRVFTAIALYNVLQFTLLKFVPLAVQFLSELLISISRIQNFLLLHEVLHLAMSDVKETNQEERLTSDDKKDAYRNIEGCTNEAFLSPEQDVQAPAQLVDVSAQKLPSSRNENVSVDSSPRDSCPSVTASNVVAKWDEAREVQTLQNVNFTVEDGALLTVVGSVGSGKSSLLSAILRELPTSSGGIRVDGKVSYASQQPWVFSGTVRQNIVFGHPYVHLKYREVIDCCGLIKDLESMPNGDLTLVGDRGITLSGGQKARINLARAVYRDADIYLLDDPLSAVDAKVGRMIFKRCIQGLLKKKIRILVTHQLQYLSYSDQILLMNEGTQLAVGTYPELLKQGFAFNDLIHTTNKDDSCTMRQSKRRRRRHSSISRGALEALDNTSDEPKEDTAQEEQDEDRFEGSVSLRAYWDYLTAGFGTLGLLVSLLLNVIYQGSYVFTDWWLAHWAAKEEEYLFPSANASAQNISEKAGFATTVDTMFYLYVFTGVTVSVVVLSTVRTLFMFYNCIMASHNLHNSMFRAVIRTPILFFDTNPVGRILNRFSKDMGQLDEQLAWQFVEFVQYSLLTVGVIIIVGVVNPWVFVPVVPLIVIFLYLRQYFLATSRDIKRLEATTRSPVFSHLSATLQGLPTIRALSADRIVQQEFDAHQDLHSEAWFLFLCTTRWLAIRLDLLTAAFVTSVAFCSVFVAQSLDGGLVGLTVSYSIPVTVFFQWTIRLSTEVETMMTSAERVLEYTKLEAEVEPKSKVQPPAGWPPQGSICLQSASFSYCKDGPDVLQELTVTIAAQEKVGIVGRTGAGKSSLMHMLMRMAEIKGNVSIDGVDISTIGLYDLRCQISVIPQDPVLFSGSLRNNLDPFEKYTDTELWSALEQVQLKHVVEELSMGLEAELAESGTNFSVGQRQLVCLARALLRRTKILIIDEATANVDPRTDEVIQQIIRSRFEHCTVLTIAHRLNTVIDSDRIMVIADGRIEEFGEPYRLLDLGDRGHFGRLVAELGTAEAARIKSVAYQAFQQKHHEVVGTRL